MGDVTIDAQVFWERLAKLHKSWTAQRGPEELWKGADALVIDKGKDNEDELYSKSAALQTWLLGYEFPETVLVIGFKAVHVLTSKKKVQYLEPLKTAENAVLPLELLTRNATDANAANFEALLSGIRSSHSGAVVATLGKEKPLGEFVSAWRGKLADSGLTPVEIAPALADLLAVKDLSEVALLKRAGIASAMVMTKHFVTSMEDVVDKEKKVTHEKLALDAEEAISEPAKLGMKLSADDLVSCYTPIIQSGGEFDLRPSAASNEKNLYFSTITCSLGVRYKQYCANVGRTYIINPTKSQEKTYKILTEIQQEAISALRPGVALSAAYHAALNRLKSKRPDLEKKLTKNVGTAIGIEFREGSLQLNAKNEARVREGMAFNVAVGLEGLEDKDATDKRASTYALFLADTVIVKADGAPDVFTDKALKGWSDISYQLNAEDDDEVDGGGGSSKRGGVEVMDSRTRGAGKAQAAAQEVNDQLAEHQSELEAKMRQDALERVRRGEGGAAGPSGPIETPIAYKSPDHYPANLTKPNQSVVDGKAETLLLPVFGRLVPFHISTIKNVSLSEESGWTFLRLNFVAPPATTAQPLPREAGDDDHFIKEVTLKAKVGHNLKNTFRLIKELRKRVQTREKEAALKKDLVTQEPLQLIRTGKVSRLRDVYVRPSVGGKKAAGELQLHSNGLRFQAPRGEKLDLNFKNIKLAFFQPAQKEVLVLIHFHLHDPIMIGKRKTKDVQFYVEVMEASYSLDAARRSGHDPDELEEEQRERVYRNRMNQEFQQFAKRVEEAAAELSLEFDIPYRELGFYGVPPHGKATCHIMPAVNAIVELTEPPWFCVPLNDIEVAHFERVVYGLKNFDLVLVLKDYSQKPVMVSAIGIEHLDSLKSWLDSCNIKFYEGTANLNWGNIMKTINGMGIEEFYDDGGWKNVLAMDSDDEGGEEESEEESEFEPSESESEEEEESDDDEEYASEDSEDSGEESLDSDESEGKDFEQLEQEAKRADKVKGRFEEEERPKSKGAKRRGDYSASESDSEDDRKKAKAKKAKSAAPPPKGKSGSSSGKFGRK
mmetsp:Transcript_3937/g.10265  ORF Transcript_3937/g.10265 Transcript_3937/m.10265 type:complete len:1060 (+) Transcript_3937:110-3289(+)